MLLAFTRFVLFDDIIVVALLDFTTPLAFATIVEIVFKCLALAPATAVGLGVSLYLISLLANVIFGLIVTFGIVPELPSSPLTFRTASNLNQIKQISYSNNI